MDFTCDTFEWPANTEVKLTDCVCISAAGECGPLLGQYTLNCSPRN